MDRDIIKEMIEYIQDEEKGREVWFNVEEGSATDYIIEYPSLYYKLLNLLCEKFEPEGIKCRNAQGKPGEPGIKVGE